MLPYSQVVNNRKEVIEMPLKVTLTVDKETRKIMDRLPGVNWSRVFRKAVQKVAAVANGVEKRLAEED